MSCKNSYDVKCKRQVYFFFGPDFSDIQYRIQRDRQEMVDRNIEKAGLILYVVKFYVSDVPKL